MPLGTSAVWRGCGVPAPAPRAARVTSGHRTRVTSGHRTRAKEEEGNVTLLGVQGAVPKAGLWDRGNGTGCGAEDSGRGRGQSQMQVHRVPRRKQVT